MAALRVATDAEGRLLLQLGQVGALAWESRVPGLLVLLLLLLIWWSLGGGSGYG